MVINSHRGLFQYKQITFGVSTAPGVFQGVMESILSGIPNGIVYIDDILDTGPNEDAHLEALEEVLKHLAAAGLRFKCILWHNQ